MSEETKTQETQVQEVQEIVQTDVAEQSTEAPKSKTYSESEVNAMMATRLAKQEKAIKERLQAEHEEQLKRQKLDEVERLKLEKEDAIKEREEALKLAQEEASKAKKDAKRYQLQAELASKVRDADAAYVVAEAKGFVTDEGLNVDAFLEAYPYFANNVAPSKTPIQAANSGLSSEKPITMESLKDKDPSWINANWNEINAALKKKN